MSRSKQRYAAYALSSLLALAAADARAQTTTESETAVSSPEAANSSEIVVTGRRVARDLSTIPSSITVIGGEEIDAQTAISENVGSFLQFNVPGIAPQDGSIQTVAVLRGRTALILVDGVPQNQLLRGSGYDTNVLAPEVLARVEVLRGASALYGFGSTGGIINFITKTPPREGLALEVTARTAFQTSKFEPTKEIYAQVEIGLGDIGGIFSAGFDSRGDRYDARGNLLSNFNDAYGDDRLNLFGKIAWNIAPDHELILSANYMSQVSKLEDYAILLTQTDPRTRQPTLAGRSEGAFFLDYDAQEAGTPPVIPTDLGVRLFGDKFVFTNGTLTYRAKDILGSSVEVQGLFHRVDIRFPFSRFAGAVSAQSRRSERKGVRLTISSPLDAVLPGANLIWGVDYLNYVFDEGFIVPARGILKRDRTLGRLTPYTVQDSLGFFGQLDWTIGKLTLTGGVRREDYKVNLHDANLSDFDPTVLFTGGKVKYGATTFNAGAVYAFNDDLNAFVSFNQGLDVTAIAGAAFLVSDASLIDPQVAKTNSYEAGLRYRRGGIAAEIAAFVAESKLASRSLSLPGFIVVPLRQPEKIWGIEAVVTAKVDDALTLGGTFTYQKGTQEQADGTNLPVPNSFISPPSIAAYAEYGFASWLRGRLQSFYTFKTDRFGDDLDRFDGLNRGDYESRLTLDASLTFDGGELGRFTVGVENLFNSYYFRPGTLAGNYFYDFEPAVGRTVTLSYNKRF